MNLRIQQRFTFNLYVYSYINDADAWTSIAEDSVRISVQVLIFQAFLAAA